MQDFAEFVDKHFAAIGADNGVIKRIRGVANNTKPNPERLFVAEGIWMNTHIINEGTEVVYLVVCPQYVYTPEAEAAVRTLAERCADRFVVSAKTFDKIAEKDKPDGVLTLAKLPTFNINDFRVDSKGIVLVIDGVEIPGNIGTMLRVADGAGIDAVFLCNRKARLTHPKLIHSSMLAVLTVPVYEFESVDACAEWLTQRGFTIYLADSRADKMYYELPYGTRTAFVLGSERYGIAREWYAKTPSLVAIPMLGKCDSLNVGVAATVLLYEASIKNKLGFKR
jgi:TrmH family RNA methyltransferase